MPQVETARGPVDTAALGRVLRHEHVFVLTAGARQPGRAAVPARPYLRGHRVTDDQAGAMLARTPARIPAG